MPLRLTTPTLPGFTMDPGMMPTLLCPGEMRPGQFGPTNLVGRLLRYAETSTMSRTGIPSLMQTTSGILESTAS